MQTTLIYGPPGTGKTHALKERVSSLRGSPALCLSFTRAAARELAQRIPGIEASTIHSLAYRRLELSPYEIVSCETRANFTARTGIEFASLRGDEALTAGDEYLSLLSYARNTFQKPGILADKVRLGTSAQFLWFCDVYPRWKTENHLVDFDDMLHRIEPDMLKGNWGALVIDEAQDLNPIQWRIIRDLIRVNNFSRVWVAGDDDQAIYSWAGADPQGLEKFSVETKAEIEVLSQSYRIPSLVHTTADRIIHRIKDRQPKEYRPRASEGEFEILTRLEKAKDYDAILYRNHSVGRQIAVELSILGIPYFSRNLPSPFGSRWSKLVIAYQRLINGELIASKQVQALEKMSNRSIGDLANQKRFWINIFPGLPVNLRSNLLLIEARFGPLWQANPLELTTIHQYKGKEADSVLLIDGMNERTREGFAMDPDSEYRVFYVGVTRARQKLGIYEHDNPIGVGRLR